MAAIQIMTMNLGTGSKQPYIDPCVATHAVYLNALRPDIVFLQEVDRCTRRSGKKIDQFENLRSLTHLQHGHFVKWHHESGGEYGLGLLSRFPLISPGNTAVTKMVVLPFPILICQIVSAQVTLNNQQVQLFGTHFPLRAGDQQLAGDVATTLINTATPTIFGGDFNAGRGSAPLAGIEKKLTSTRNLAPNQTVEPNNDPSKDDIDHIFISNSFTAHTFFSVEALFQGRRFSDHPIVRSDIELAASPTPPPPTENPRCNQIKNEYRHHLKAIEQLAIDKANARDSNGRPDKREIARIDKDIQHHRTQMSQLSQENQQLGCPP